MNAIKKIGLTALAGSLVATSVFAGEMSVTGSAGINLGNQDKLDKGNGFTMSDAITFSGSGEMDNGWTVAVSMELDNNAQQAAGNNLDDRSVTIGMGDMGTVTFSGHGGSSAFSAVDDVMPTAYGEAWDILGTTTTGGSSGEPTNVAVAKLGSIGGTTADNTLKYNNSSFVDGLSVTASYLPSNGTVVESVTSFAIAYTGVEGLTVGLATDENGLAGTSGIDYETMYVKYAYGPVTVGYQVSEEDSATAADNDEFTAYGISYAVSDDLTISYNESTYDAATIATDQEQQAIAVSYTMGSMSVTATSVSMDNAGGSTDAIDDVQGYELNLSFAF